MRFIFLPVTKVIKNKKSSSFILLVIAALLFMGAAMLIFAELVERQKIVMSAVEEDALWAAYQLDRETLKLRSSLKLLEDDFTNERLVDARTRFDILYSRINVLEKGQLRVLFDRLDNSDALMKTLKHEVADIDQLLFRDQSLINVQLLINKSNVLLKETEGVVLSTLASRSREKVKQRNDTLGLFLYLGSLIALLTITMTFIIIMLFKQLKVARESFEKSQKLTKDLENAVFSAEQALKVKSEFLATMSHEIRTPMNAIVGFSYLLSGADIKDEHREKVTKIQQSADALLAIINSVLDYSKIESGKMDLENSPFSLDEVLEYVYQTNEGQAKSKNLSFMMSRDFTLNNTLVGDKTRLQQVLINVVGNAVKFTHSGSVNVNVYRLNTEEIAIDVKDTGIGIPEGVNVFDVFKQADSSTTRLHGGTGLGLSITQKLVVLLGGHISYESVVDGGSIFTIKLPYTPDSRQDLVPLEKVSILEEDTEIVSLLSRLNVDRLNLVKFSNLTEKDLPILASHHWLNEEGMLFEELKSYEKSILFLNGSFLDKEDFVVSGLVTPTNINKKIAALNLARNQLQSTKAKNDFLDKSEFFRSKSILLAEDNKINANIVKAIIEKMGVSVDWVENGKDAYERSLNESYDLILMDIRMPIMDGYESSRKIFETLGDRKPPILFLTADTVDLEQNSLIGIDDVLFKPLDPYLLIEKIESWMIKYDFDSLKKKDRRNCFLSDEKDLDVLWSELEMLESLLVSGDSDSEEVLKNIMAKISGYKRVGLLESALEDSLSYDYMDAINKVGAFKRALISDCLEESAN